MTGLHPALHVLDAVAYSSLTGPHAHLAQRRGDAVRYPADMSPFAALPPQPEPQDWDDLAALVGPGAVVALPGLSVPPPPPWQDVYEIPGVQLVDDGVAAGPEHEAVRLTPADVPEMLDLVERTRPGPFLPRTIELGTYLGVRRDGRLIAMAGERLHPPGWTEISAVCTDDAFRGQGLAGRLVLAVAHGIRERGDIPLLHAAATNTGAIRLYETLGFRQRRPLVFRGVRAPEVPRGQ